ncbi:hypothetical protein FHX06_002047 [Rhizobium sp. BK512]|nr:hypothetical protein [Rhizobium sp. BK379]MBB3560736.1 hypothetical protein [Rhizobium sp. BK512]
MRKIKQTHDIRIEPESPRAGSPKFDPTALGAALECEPPQGRNWATLLILLSIVFVQLFVIGLVIWTIFR